MTCIAAVVGPRGKIVMGGDSASTDSNWQQLSAAEDKLFRLGEFIIGTSGSWRGAQLARYAFIPPKRLTRTPIDQYMATSFIDGLRKAWKEGGHLFKSKSEDEPAEETVGTTMLIGYRGMLWIAESDLQVIRMRDDYAAIGSGADVALGALWATQQEGATKVRILTALKAAERYNAAVRGPFLVLTNEGTGEPKA